ncbi:hypothetical protein HF086_017191 [Spodoptera exigua]|uniref:DUF5641 domain-containing protein n=1 Tax=Spodoptera exigua TaxID=7107 RepID=A0A922SE54_SPOEX|nr:hypothetical protein HF086_017191 [Spodoptera exigua]
MFTFLTCWRTYRYVFTADVEKLYRFIWLNAEQQHLQTIIWRSHPKEPLQEWKLRTVTYGMKCAPYLAMRTLHKLAQDEQCNYPEASKVLKSSFYMDDLVYGKDTIEASKKLISQLIELLNKGGFNLRKWKSNETAILEDLRDDQKSSDANINFSPEQTTNQTTKMLGMRWNQSSDCFTYSWNLSEKKNLTKRTLLSEISKLYDPLGFLSPFIIKTKLLFQKIWISKITWDEPLCDELINEWETLRKDIPLLSQIAMPRWLQCHGTGIEIHGFCDASEKAYACVIYSRVRNLNDEYVTTLVTAKTKVAPLNKRITLPKMELCGALLLAKLIEKVKQTLDEKTLQIRCWSDSKVVLAWLQGDINRWEKYVANRVAQINNITPATHWNYVRSEENPADCASRGLLPSKLVEFNLWWEGPSWLKTYDSKNSQDNYCLTYITNNGLQSTKCCVSTYKTCDIIKNLLNKYSSLKRVIRVLGWILRVFNMNNKEGIRSNNSLTDCEGKRKVMCLSTQEIKAATDLVVKNVQREYFRDEMERLEKKLPISSKSSLLKLSPFLDEYGLLRAKGRLINSTLPPESKQPLIIPATGRLTELIIQEAHNDTLHGGARLTLAYVRLKFWVIEEQEFAENDLRNRWRLVEQLNIQIWKRWSNEYLHQLQVRSKWQQSQENLKEGSLVLVKDEHLPPGRWALGRVNEIHPGADGRVRVVTLKTKKATLKRPITKLAPLPLQTNEENQAKKPPSIPEPKKRGPTGANKNALSLILMSILTMTALTQSTPITNNLQVTPIVNTHPVYFDETGQLQLIHDEWTLLIYYNLTSYWQATNEISAYIDQIETLCNRISHEYSPCETVVSHLRHELEHLAEYNSMLLSQHSRQRRGYFDGIGKLSRTLFGTLDVDFANKYEKDIQNMQLNDNYLLQLMKNQTLVIEAENNVVKKNAEFMEKQLKRLKHT